MSRLPQPGERARILSSEAMDRWGVSGKTGEVIVYPSVCIALKLDDASGTSLPGVVGEAGVVLCTISEIELEEGSETMTRDVESCTRCGEAHEGVEYAPISNAPEWVNWWASCPKTGEPMLLSYDPDREQQTFAEACVDSLEKSIGEARSAASGLSLAAREKLAGQVMPGDLGELEAALNTAEEEVATLRRGVSVEGSKA